MKKIIENIKNVIKNKNMEEMLNILKKDKDTNLSFFIDSSLFINERLYFKYCNNAEDRAINIFDIKRDWIALCNCFTTYADYLETKKLEEFIEQEDEQEDTNIIFNDNIVEYYNVLERKKYPEDGVKNFEYRNITDEDLNY